MFYIKKYIWYIKHLLIVSCVYIIFIKLRTVVPRIHWINGAKLESLNTPKEHSCFPKDRVASGFRRRLYNYARSLWVPKKKDSFFFFQVFIMTNAIFLHRVSSKPKPKNCSLITTDSIFSFGIEWQIKTEGIRAVTSFSIHCNFPDQWDDFLLHCFSLLSWNCSNESQKLLVQFFSHIVCFLSMTTQFFIQFTWNRAKLGEGFVLQLLVFTFLNLCSIFQWIRALIFLSWFLHFFFVTV